MTWWNLAFWSKFHNFCIEDAENDVIKIFLADWYSNWKTDQWIEFLPTSFLAPQHICAKIAQ